MNRSRAAMLAALLALGLSPLWVGGTREASASSAGGASTSPFLPSPPLGPPRETVFYGHAKSLVRKSGRWELRVDPAEFLVGLAAERAAAEDGAIRPGEPVPNDYYTRDEGHRLLTFRVPGATHVTVVTRGLRATPIGVAELARALAGKPTPHRLFEPQAGFWIHVAGDTVRGIDQQYTP
jgi:hypothetical protein